jgi:Tripartite tricarboxylate transporter TctB family
MRRLLKVDVLAGFLFIAFAAWGFVASRELEVGTSMSMGPGYFPRLISGLLLALGIAIAGVGFVTPAAPFVRSWSIRPLLLVSVAALSFALLLQGMGIVIAISVTVIIGSFAGERLRPFDLLLLVVSLILASIALFVWGIGIPLRIWPSWQN